MGRTELWVTVVALRPSDTLEKIFCHASHGFCLNWSVTKIILRDEVYRIVLFSLEITKLEVTNKQ